MTDSVGLTDNQFNPDGFWSEPINKLIYIPTREDVDLFDQNGYALTDIECRYAYSNGIIPKMHRRDQFTLKEDWFVQNATCIEGAVLNHSFLSERKGYSGEALAELKRWARDLPLLHKIISIRPKWGMDFSMDYVDSSGNCFEILHWEWDSFDYDTINSIKHYMDALLLSIDWKDAANNILNKKEEWYHLDFFAQSDWKCNYFGIPKEQFKLVIWK